MPESPGTNGPSPRHPGAEHPHHGPGPMAAIAGGGALGTLARYGVERAVAADTLGFPWATLTVNVVGSFVLGVVITLLAGRWPDDRWLRPLVAVGFCGGFTTFSTFALEIDQRARHGHAGAAAAYLVASLVAGLGAALVGSALARGRTGPGPEGAYLPDPDLLAGDDPPPGGHDATGGPA
ncbi:MAG TPA: fluoride efflux transporter CrcB [Acidimicrobiales bacterium]